jgi:hypothetical protein
MKRKRALSGLTVPWGAAKTEKRFEPVAWGGFAGVLVFAPWSD